MQKVHTLVVPLDIRRPSIKTCHIGLVYKLIKMHFHDYLIRLTASSFLQDLSPISEFRGEDDFRHLLEIKAGVSQGLVLPVRCTYALYIKDIPTYAREHAALSADGTVLFSFDADTYGDAEFAASTDKLSKLVFNMGQRD
jgi:hypothetical protein